MDTLYSYRLPARRLITWVFAGIMIALMVLAYVDRAPWYIWAVWVPSFAMIVYMLVQNPVSGLQLTQDTLILSPWQSPRQIALRDIDRVEFIDWSDSTDMQVHLINGDVIRVFSADIPPQARFMSQLADRGIRIVER